uniref:Zinc finger PMZ-type domain-containing protein n=1 Tax=Lactuca sativa TaxID=4236 RepID=A0A9R1W953_LACSA|nr:hypothetical protein LSAT_V11C300154240 [Lactuca sativa]
MVLPHTIAPDLDKDYSELFNILFGVSWFVYSKLIDFSFSDGHGNFFTLKIHHGGFFTKFPGRKYIERRLAFFDFVDTDLFSVHDLNDMIREIGYSKDDIVYYHYRIPNLDLDFGLKALGNDQDVIPMAQYVPQNSVINVYIEHGSTRLHTYFMSPSKVVIEKLDDDPSPELNRIRPKKKGIGSCSKKLDTNVPLKESANQAHREDGVYDFSISLVPFEPNKQDVVNEFKNDSYFPYHREILNDFEPFSSDGYQNMGEFEREVEVEEEQDEKDKQGHAEDSKDDSEEHTEEEDDSDYIVDMREFNSCMDEVEWFGQGPNIELDLNQDDDLGVINNDEFESAGYEEDLRKRMLKNLNKKVLCSSGVVHVTPFLWVKGHMKMLSIKTRRALQMSKKEKLRVRVKCKRVVPDSTGGGPSTVSKVTSKDKPIISQKDSCPFAIQISRSTEENVKACTSRYLASTILQKLDSDPRIPVTTLQEDLQMDLELSISRMKVFRAKSIAKEQLYGDYERQYNLLRDYCLELQTNKPGTTVKLEVCNEANLDAETRIFKRIYIFLRALKLGFTSRKRELLGLDGCFLKGPHPGQILIVVGLDSNNGICPLAYTVVEAETTRSWTWFLECLDGDLDVDASCNFTFGIIHAIAKVFPNAEHRWFLRHIHENMGEEFRDHLWRCATNTSIRHFERVMNEFKDFSAEAHEWLSKIPPVHWAKSHVTGRAHSDCLLNNLCEVFNSKLEHGRDKPTITCLDYIRVILTPTITTILDAIKTTASKHRALFHGSGKYQVTEGTCSCRYWEIIGIVYRHGVCAIWEHIQNGYQVHAINGH